MVLISMLEGIGVREAIPPASARQGTCSHERPRSHEHACSNARTCPLVDHLETSDTSLMSVQIASCSSPIHSPSYTPRPSLALDALYPPPAF